MSLIFDIKRFAINDGPGIRTTLFMKGCPLRCVWCHNPEGQTERPALLFTNKKCIACHSCADACPQGGQGIPPKPSECLLCGACVDACPTLALRMSGREWPMDELMTVVEKERKVMEESGGGVTICGGEPLMHPDYLMQLLEELGRRGFHRAVDTTLLSSADIVRRVAANSELFLVDLKHMDSNVHRRYTGVPNERILDNIRLIAELGCRYFIRIPFIEGINADEENIERSAAFLASLPKQPEEVNLLPYHDIGKGKHERMGTCYNPDDIPMTTPSEAVQQRALAQFAAHGIAAKIGG